MKTSSRRRQRRPQAGFTLIELMISLVLFSFAIAGVLAVAVSMVNGFREQRLAVSTESAARGALNFLSDALRGASPGVPTGDITQTAGGCGEGALTVVNNPGNPDELYAVFASGSVVTTSTTLYDGSGTTLSVIDGSQIAVGDTLLLTNNSKGRLVEVTGVATNDLTISAVACAAASVPSFPSFAAGTVVIRARRAHFFIDSPDGIPTLFMDPDAEGPGTAEPLAEGIEDMQIAIGIDQDGNGLSENATGGDLDEWVYNHSGDTVPAVPLPIGTIRALRITLIARAVGKVTGVGSFLRPAAEDHSISGTADNYRRRVLKSVIEVRNLGGSP